MTAAADLVLTNAEVHTLGSPDETHEAVAVRDGEVVRVGRAFDVGLLAGVETRVVDCGGRSSASSLTDSLRSVVRLRRAVSAHSKAVIRLSTESGDNAGKNM